MRIHAMIAAALLVAAPTILGAQFTTPVPPPRASQPAQAAQATAENEARADSIRRVQLSDMREWVDSAAVAIAAMPDTLTVEVDSGEVVVERPQPPRAPEPTTEFREGAPAPETATGLPLLALLGIGALGFGALLLGRPRA